MSQAYQDLARREKRLADKLAESAVNAGLSCVSRSLVTVSTLLVKELMKDSGLGAVSEPAADLRGLRTNYKLVIAKQDDLRQAHMVYQKELTDALREGYEYDATERAKLIVAESTGLNIHVDLTEQELKDIESFPVNGLTCKEWSDKAIYNLGSAIDQALAKPITGAIDIRALPGALNQTAINHANSLGSLVRESFFSGGKASMLALRAALPLMRPSVL